MGLVKGTSHVRVKRRSGEITGRGRERTQRGQQKVRTEAFLGGRGSRGGLVGGAVGDPGRERLKGEGFQSLPGSGKEDAGNEEPADHHEWLRSQAGNLAGQGAESGWRLL